MLSHFSKKLTKISSAKLTIFSFFLFLIFMFIVLPIMASQSIDLFAGLGSPDLLFYYDEEKLYEMAAAYDEVGRNGYIKTRFQFDLIWPIVYTLFLATSISWFSSRVTNIQSKLRYFNLLPIAATMFDLFENISVSVVMYQFPIKTAVFSKIASCSTTIKWLFVYTSFLALAAFLVVFLVMLANKKYLKNSKQRL